MWPHDRILCRRLRRTSGRNGMWCKCVHVRYGNFHTYSVKLFGSWDIWRCNPRTHVSDPVYEQFLRWMSKTLLTISQYCFSQWPGAVMARRQDITWANFDPSVSSYGFTRPQYINSLWPSDAIWRHRSGSALAQIMACRLTAPSH